MTSSIKIFPFSSPSLIMSPSSSSLRFLSPPKKSGKGENSPLLPPLFLRSISSFFSSFASSHPHETHTALTLPSLACLNKKKIHPNRHLLSSSFSPFSSPIKFASMKEDTLGTNTPGTNLRCYSSSSFSFLQGKKNSHPLLRPFLGRVREAETTSLFSPPPPLPQHLREERRRFMHQDTSTSSRSSHEEEEEGETDMLEIPLGSVTDGKVVRVSIKEGQLVTKDEVLMRLTCCENVEVLIRAPFRGVVASIGVREGDVIQRGHIIAVLIPQSLDH